MSPGKFDGSQSLETFLAQFNTCADYNRWTEKDKCAFLKCSLVGGPAQLLWDSGDPEKLKFSQLKERLLARYGSAGQAEKFRVELQSRRRRQGETLADLHADIRRLMALAYPDAHGNSVCELIARDHFLSALGNRELELKLREREPPDLDAALRLALRLEAYAVSFRRDSDVKGSPPRPRRDRDRDDKLAYRVAQIEKSLTQQPAPAEKPSMLTAERGTDWRRRYDELVKEFEKLKLLDEQRRFTSTSTTSNSKNIEDTRREYANQPRCYGCGEPGHFRRTCPVEPRRQPGSSRPSENRDAKQVDNVANVRCSSTENASTGNKSGGAFLRLRIQGVPTDCLLDTGAEVTLIPWRLSQGVDVQPCNQKLRAANGTAIPIIGRTTLTAFADSQYLTIDGLVTKHVPNVIIGLEWLKRQAAVWNFESGVVELNGHAFELHGSSSRLWCRRVVVQESTTIQPFTEAVLSASVIYNDLHDRLPANENVWTTVLTEPTPGLRVSRTIIPDRSADVPVRVLNITKVPIQLNVDDFVADLEPGLPCSSSNTTGNDVVAAEYAVLKNLVDRIDETVSSQCRQQLNDLLIEFRDVFSFSDNDIGRTSVLRHAIVTNDARPVRQTLRRQPPPHQAAIKEHVSTMLQQSVIEPAQSPWASNIVLVKKKDGSLRCCIDYRGLNNVTRKDAYPLPRTDVCLDAMNGAKWFTTFDLRSSYHQVELEPVDADKTAFICREGSFRFVTMPFGLCNAGATFQRLMDMVMAGLNFEICLIYLDDIIIYSTTPEQHIERLRAVLTRLRGAGLKLKPSKCDVMRSSVEFLGHRVSADGIEPHPQKISAVTDWPTPETLRELRAFLGLCGYYRRFVDHFSSVTSPLYSLTEKGRPFNWNAECQIAFEQLKRHLTSCPILCMPTSDDAFVLDTDASDAVIGAVLSQQIDGTERVVAYASKRLSKAEINYCVTRRELLAVVYFVRYFRHYLLGRSFTVRTDHAALQWLRRIPEPVGQQARWLGLLEEFDYTVIHRPGNRHGNADAMSRRPCPRARCCPKEAEYSDETVAAVCNAVTDSDGPEVQDIEPVWSLEQIGREQAEDPEVGPIHSLFSAGGDCPPWDSVAHLSEASKTLWRQWSRLTIIGGVMMRRFEDDNPFIERSTLQTILPRCRRLEFIEMVHNGVTGGHLGRRRTEAGVRRRVYWPAWTTDVRRALQRCNACAQYHRGKAPKLTPLKPLAAGEPWETVSIDITGPHPRSNRGYTYILTVQDHFTKWAEALPLRNHTAPIVASALFNNVLIRFGMPLRLLSDQGAEFESELFQELCRHMCIAKIRTTPYRPSTNGMVERLHRTMNSMLAKVVRADQRNWCQLLQGVMAAYRATPHEATGFSPNILTFGRENRMPVDIVLGCPNDQNLPCSTTDDYVADLQSRLRTGYQSVRAHLGKAAEARKKQYDVGVRSFTVKVGDWVWYFYPRRRAGLSPKWQKWYEGPYLVTRIIDSH